MDGSKSTVSQYESLCSCLYVDDGVGNAHLFGAECVWGEHELRMLLGLVHFKGIKRI
jgi:hypothetical protein